jgi:ectoine hydroxylase-related dioxygenase (phytanoyl-CoA dioxygenase family)
MENAERLGRIEGSLIGKKSGIDVLKALPLDASRSKKLKDGSLLAESLLLRDGCVSIKNAISAEMADKLFEFVGDEKTRGEGRVENNEAEYDTLFGAVNNRRNRADMFLPYSDDLVRSGLLEAFQNLGPLINSLQSMKSDGVLHELSSIISDPGSPTQCVHCDTPWLPNAEPLYTCFIALQDIDDDMGHTTYLPRTHTDQAHKIFNAGVKQKENLISVAPAVQTRLKKGDCVIFDSRVLHCGGANSSEKRRVLFYFTITAGDTLKNNPNPKRGMGSIRMDDWQKHTVASLNNAVSETAKV